MSCGFTRSLPDFVVIKFILGVLVLLATAFHKVALAFSELLSAVFSANDCGGGASIAAAVRLLFTIVFDLDLSTILFLGLSTLSLRRRPLVAASAKV